VSGSNIFLGVHEVDPAPFGTALDWFRELPAESGAARESGARIGLAVNERRRVNVSAKRPISLAAQNEWSTSPRAAHPSFAFAAIFCRTKRNTSPGTCPGRQLRLFAMLQGLHLN
jgi:hypothetical protein